MPKRKEASRKVRVLFASLGLGLKRETLTESTRYHRSDGGNQASTAAQSRRMAERKVCPHAASRSRDWEELSKNKSSAGFTSRVCILILIGLMY